MSYRQRNFRFCLCFRIFCSRWYRYFNFPLYNNFLCNFENTLGLYCCFFTPLCWLSSKQASLSQPIKFRITLYNQSRPGHSRFPRFRQFAWFNFGSSLAPCEISFLWLAVRLLCFLVLRQSIEMRPICSNEKPRLNQQFQAFLQNLYSELFFLVCRYLTLLL